MEKLAISSYKAQFKKVSKDELRIREIVKAIESAAKTFRVNMESSKARQGLYHSYTGSWYSESAIIRIEKKYNY